MIRKRFKHFLMEITDIKNNLNIFEVADHLDIQVDPKTKKALCPFHDDKNPSLQFSKEKQIATCFSSNCDAGTMDVISLTQKKLQLSTHETLKYLSKLVALPAGAKQKPVTNLSGETPDYHQDFEQMQSSLIASSTARRYAESRNLNWKSMSLAIGYNAFKGNRFCYLRGCITFGLRDERGKVIAMYGRSIRDNDQAKHYYTINRKGLYPGYPKPETTKLILTESIIDAATLLQLPEIAKDYEILALYGTNGLTKEHIHAIQQLESLKEIILFFDGDQAGKAAHEKHGKYLQQFFPTIRLSVVSTPANEDINSLAQGCLQDKQGHPPKIFLTLLKNRTLFSSSEKAKEQPLPATQLPQSTQSTNELNTRNPYKILYTSETATYYVKGGIRKDLDSLKITLEIQRNETKQKLRDKLELYEYKQIERYARVAAEKLNLRADLVENDLNRLADLLDEYRESLQEKKEEKAQLPIISTAERQQLIAFGKTKDLMQAINELIGQSGIVGEERNRLFLFTCAASHRMRKTLHVVVQGSSGSGKSHTIGKIADLMPQEKTKRYTRVSDKSFYNYGEHDLCNTLIILEDYDGMTEDAELAWRELQSNEKIISSIAKKDEQQGAIKSGEKVVRGPIASIVATTKAAMYLDNQNRVFFIAIDESEEQTQQIIDYKNRLADGEINKTEQERARNFLQNFVRTLQPMEVRNPWLKHIRLPVSNEQLRRLHGLLDAFCEQITLIHQHQRKKDEKRRIVSEKQDMRIAIELMFESIILKVDELDGSLRNFYEKLKGYVLKKGRKYEFTQREIRQAFKTSKTQLQRYITALEQLEYVQKKGQGAYGAITYRITYWDDNQALRQQIRENLEAQLKKL